MAVDNIYDIFDGNFWENNPEIVYRPIEVCVVAAIFII